jgi:hypothetical protein
LTKDIQPENRKPPAMTIRLTLLVLMTALFAAAWSHDARSGAERRLARAERTERASTPAVGRHEPVVIELPAPIEEPDEPAFERSAGPVLPVMPTMTAERPASALPARPVHWRSGPIRTVTEFDGLPLPTGIRPGVYRAVSNHGEARQVRLTASDLGGLSADGAQDLYIYRSGETRWYFVRLDGAAEDVLPPAVAECPAEMVAQRAAREALARFGRRLHTAAARTIGAGAALTGRLGEALSRQTPRITDRFDSIRNWIGDRMPSGPAPRWSSRPAEAERQ